jgi:DNA-binding response OmpR family regulator
MTDRVPQVVLIVEHDDFLRLLAADIMDDAGFATIQASDADAALAILETRTDIALLVTSITMPGSMDGRSHAHMARERWPVIRIIITSSRMSLKAVDFPPGSRFVPKPYRVQAMISEMRSLIGQNPTLAS